MKKITTLVILILLLSLLAACVEALPPTPTPTPTPLPLGERAKKRVEEGLATLEAEFTRFLESLKLFLESLKFWETSKTPSERITEPSGSGLTIGKPAIVDNTGGQGLRCRTSPDTKDSSNIVTKLMDGTEVEVIDGPITKPDYTWWKVKTLTHGSCWVAAGDWLHPIPIATPAVTAQAVYTDRDLRVVIDPGHGWRDNRGASGLDNMLEREIVLDIAVLTKAILENEYRVLVVMTRTEYDLEHDLAHAAKVVNEQNPDIAVSIHANTGGGTGTEACHTVGKDTDAESKKLARLLTNSISTRLSLTNRGIFPENADDRCGRGRDKLYIHDMNPPAAIIEVAFIDNANDAELLRTRKQDFAQAIADAIMEHLPAE